MWAYVRTGVFALVGIPATMVLARLLSPVDFGIAAAATFFGQFAGRLSSGGMGNALVRIKDLRPDHLSTVFVVNAAGAALGSVALIVAAPHIAAFYGRPEIGWVLPVVAINFALGALSMVQQALLARDLRYREMAIIGSLDVTVAAIAAVVFASLGFRYWSLVLGDVCGAAVKWIYGVWVVGWHVRFRFVPAAARELSSFALGSYAMRLLEHLTVNVDNIVIGRLLGITALGFYDKAFSVANRVFNKMTVVGPGVSFRIFAIIQDDPDRFRRAYRKVIMTATLLGYVAFAALGTMAPHLIVVAFGAQWHPSIVPFQLLCVSFSMKLLNQYSNSAAQARGWMWSQVWRQIVQIACIAVGVYFARPWGITGAALAIVGATVAMFFLTQGMMRTATGLGWSDVLEPQAPAIATAAAIVSILWGVDILLATKGAAPAVILLTQACAGALFMLAFAWCCPFREARVLMHEVVSDLSPRLARFVWKDVRAGRKTAAPSFSTEVQAGDEAESPTVATRAGGL